MHHLLCPHCWAAFIFGVLALIPIIKIYVPKWKNRLTQKIAAYMELKTRTDDCSCCDDTHRHCDEKKEDNHVRSDRGT